MSNSGNLSTTIRFCVMMFLQFFIWGVWYVPMWNFLGTLNVSDELRGFAYSFTGIAAIFSPFLVGMIADRFFASQLVLGVLHIVGGVLIYLAGQATSWGTFWPPMLGHLLCYMPTLAMVNSVCFQNMESPERQFPAIRTLGTIGWIASGILVGGAFLNVASEFVYQKPVFIGGAQPEEAWTSVGFTNLPYTWAAIASLVLGVFAFFLPNTPPKLKGKSVSVGDVIGAKALGLLKEPSFAIFVVASFLICIPLSFYFGSANTYLGTQGVQNTEFVMTWGQFSEIGFLLLVPFFFRKLGVKWMLIIGMTCWVLRYVLFANGGSEAHLLLFAGVILHGICYDFFFVTGQLYVDKKAPDDTRSAAQGFIAFVTLGAGMFVGGLLNGWWKGQQTQLDEKTGVETVDWQTFWYLPAGMAAVVLLIFAFTFHERSAKAES